MKHFIILILFILKISAAQSQYIQGTVKDEKGNPQPFVSIVIAKLPDSTFVTSVISEESGQFKTPIIKSGKYLIKSTSVGFLPYYQNIEVFTQNLLLEIILKASNELLTEVTVTSKKPVIEAKGDKLVFNVVAASNTVGLNGLEVLRKSPGVTIDQQNNLMLKGRSKVQVYINGKPSMIQGNELASFLKSLRASDIQAIEMSTTPGASYDAAGGGGVINIQLKNNLKTGLNGSISTTAMQGVTPKGEGNIAVNYSNYKWNVLTSISTDNGIWHGTEDVVNMTSEKKIVRLNSFDNENRRGLSIRFRSDYKMSKKSTIGFELLKSTNIENREVIGNTQIFNTSTDTSPQVKLNSLNNTNKNNDVFNIGLNYRFENEHKLKWGIDADWNSNIIRSSSFQPNLYVNPVSGSTVMSRTYSIIAPVNIGIKMIKSDFEIPLNTSAKLNIGAKYSNVESNNNFDLYNINKSEQLLDSSQSNYFKYIERIAAGYVSLAGQKGKWEYSLGLRLERTHSTSQLTTLGRNQNKLVDTSYLNVFPSLSLTYTLNDNNAFSLSYRYSIDRPDYNDLNPFERRINDYNSSKGNPFLRPQFTNTIELGYTLFQSMNFTLNYSHTKDFAAYVTDRGINESTKQEVFFDITRNLDRMQQYGANLSFPITISKWWQGFVNIYSNYTIFKANFDAGKVIDRKVFGGGLWVQQQMEFGKGWSFDLSGWYDLNSTCGVAISNPIGVFDAGVTKKILKDRSSIKLMFNDLFRGSSWNSTSQIGNFTTYSKGTWEGRYIAINFNYRFGILKSEVKTVDTDTKNQRRR